MGADGFLKKIFLEKSIVNLQNLVKFSKTTIIIVRSAIFYFLRKVSPIIDNCTKNH